MNLPLLSSKLNAVLRVVDPRNVLYFKLELEGSGEWKAWINCGHCEHGGTPEAAASLAVPQLVDMIAKKRDELLLQAARLTQHLAEIDDAMKAAPQHAKDATRIKELEQERDAAVKRATAAEASESDAWESNMALERERDTALRDLAERTGERDAASQACDAALRQLKERSDRLRQHEAFVSAYDRADADGWQKPSQAAVESARAAIGGQGEKSKGALYDCEGCKDAGTLPLEKPCDGCKRAWAGMKVDRHTPKQPTHTPAAAEAVLPAEVHGKPITRRRETDAPLHIESDCEPIVDTIARQAAVQRVVEAACHWFNAREAWRKGSPLRCESLEHACGPETFALEQALDALGKAGG